MKNPTKFGSPHLDTPNSIYDSCKFATKSRKTNKEKSNFKSGPAARCTRFTHPTVTDNRAPQSTWPHLTDTQNRARRLTSHCLSTARSPVVRSLALCSPHSCAPTGTLGWVGGSPEQPHRWAWWLSGGTRWRTRQLHWRCDQASTATACMNPSGAQRCGSSHGEAAVSSGHVHGGTAAHNARGGACRSDETCNTSGVLT